MTDSSENDPLKSLLQSISSTQVKRSDLSNRLTLVKDQVSKKEADISTLENEEKHIRQQSQDISNRNIALQEKHFQVIQNLQVEQGTRSSLALTLESLNEKRRTLKDVVNLKKCNFDLDSNCVKETMDTSFSSVDILLNDKDVLDFFCDKFK